jgi:hypothetical protein
MNEITRYQPEKLQSASRSTSSQELTRHQRATLYFKAIRMVHTLLSEIGFQDAILPSHTAWSMDFYGFNLEVAVTQPPQMARVTSYPGYVYDPEKITAKVEMFTPGEPGEYVIRIIGMGEDGWTMEPMLVIVRKDSPDPLRESFVSVLHAIHELIRRRPALMARIKAAFDPEAKLAPGRLPIPQPEREAS